MFNSWGVSQVEQGAGLGAPEASRETAGEMRAAAVTDQSAATKANLVLTSPTFQMVGANE